MPFELEPSARSCCCSMRKNFLPFASGARNTIYLQRSSKNLPTTTILDQKEEEFVADVYEVLQ